MGDLADAAGEPVTIEVDGKVFEISPMTVGDWAEFERFAENRALEDMRRRLDFLPIEDQEARQDTLRKLTTISKKELATLASAYMDDGEASCFRMWLMLRHKQPDITREEARHLLTFKNLGTIMERLYGVEEKEGEETARPTEKG